MAYSPILGPVIALVAWSLVMLFWTAAVRGGEFRRLGITMSNIPPGSRGADLEGRAEPRAQWKSHNYTHLMEQPTLFYAVALALALMDFGGGINLWLAWGYVGFRIIHSLVQATVNRVAWRFLFFLLSTICLVGLVIHAAARLLHDGGLA